MKARTHCPPGYTNCEVPPGTGYDCVNLQANADSCGSCSNYCLENEYCYQGTCINATYTCDPNDYSVYLNPIPCGKGQDYCTCVRGVGSSVTQCLGDNGGCSDSDCKSNSNCVRYSQGVCVTNVCKLKGKDKGGGACFYPRSYCS